MTGLFRVDPVQGPSASFARVTLSLCSEGIFYPSFSEYEYLYRETDRERECLCVRVWESYCLCITVGVYVVVVWVCVLILSVLWQHSFVCCSNKAAFDCNWIMRGRTREWERGRERHWTFITFGCAQFSSSCGSVWERVCEYAHTRLHACACILAVCMGLWLRQGDYY